MKSCTQINVISLAMTIALCCPRWAGAEEKPAAAPPKVVYLDRSAQWQLKLETQINCGILTRELARQALSISARDQLGLTTRDYWLGDGMPREGDNRPFDVSASGEKPLVWELRRGPFPATAVVSKGELHIAGSRPLKLATSIVIEEMDYAEWLADMELLSQTKFTKALKEAGFSGKANVWREGASVPDDVAKMLDEMCFLPQFLAVRRLHELIRGDGESFERLAALARGYANLGMLTEFHWHPAHKVFKARALLYAQRLAAAQPKNYLAVWHRAYALAAAGCHRLALFDLQLADKLREEDAAKNKVQQPEWVELIEAHCQFNLERLDPKNNPGRMGQLARLLRFLSQELADDTAATVSEGLEAVEAMPECYRIHDGICERAGVSVKHRATSQWFDIAGQSIYDRLSAAGLPETVAAVVQEGRALGERGNAAWPAEFPIRGKLIAALREVPDPDGEPSWAALATLIEELSFAQVRRRAQFEAKSLAVSADDFLALAAPLIAKHPFRVYLDTFLSDGDKQKEAWKNLNSAATDGLEPHETEMGRNYFDKLGIIAEDAPHRKQADFTARDETQLLHDAPDRLHGALMLLCASPFSPLARAKVLESSPTAYREEYKFWSAAAAKHPRLARAYASRCLKNKRYEEAEKWLETALALSPNFSTTIELARLYQKQGKMDKWVATMESILDKPDYGLSGASACSYIARWHMRNGQWSKAEPFAQAAAASYSEWGLRSLADWNEGTFKWKEAEKLHRAIMERYSKNEFAWYFFCKRTGHGNMKAAREAVQKIIEAINAKPEEQQVWNLHHAYYFLLEGQREASEKVFAILYKKYGNPLYGLHLALFADENNHPQRRDELLQDIRQRGIQFRPQNYQLPYWAIVRLAGMIAFDLSRGGKAAINLAEAEKIAANSDVVELDAECPSCRGLMFNYFLAKYLSLHGKPEQAVDLWKKCMADAEFLSHYYRTLAGAELVDRGILPNSYLNPSDKDKHEGKEDKNDGPKKTDELNNPPAPWTPPRPGAKAKSAR